MHPRTERRRGCGQGQGETDRGLNIPQMYMQSVLGISVGALCPTPRTSYPWPDLYSWEIKDLCNNPYYNRWRNWDMERTSERPKAAWTTRRKGRLGPRTWSVGFSSIICYESFLQTNPSHIPPSWAQPGSAWPLVFGSIPCIVSTVIWTLDVSLGFHSKHWTQTVSWMAIPSLQLDGVLPERGPTASSRQPQKINTCLVRK